MIQCRKSDAAGFPMHLNTSRPSMASSTSPLQASSVWRVRRGTHSKMAPCIITSHVTSRARGVARWRSAYVGYFVSFLHVVIETYLNNNVSLTTWVFMARKFLYWCYILICLMLSFVNCYSSCCAIILTFVICVAAAVQWSWRLWFVLQLCNVEWFRTSLTATCSRWTIHHFTVRCLPYVVTVVTSSRQVSPVSTSRALLQEFGVRT